MRSLQKKTSWLKQNISEKFKNQVARKFKCFVYTRQLNWVYCLGSGLPYFLSCFISLLEPWKREGM